MKKSNLSVRIALFGLVLALGTVVALILGETTGLALADLSSTAVETIVETPQNNVLFATLENQKRGIYRSDDYGRSWQLVSPGPEGNLGHLAVHPVNKQLLYASTDTGLWYSRDGGEKWQAYDLDLAGSQPAEISVLKSDPTNPEVLYIGTRGQGLYRVQPETDHLEALGDNSMQTLYVEDILPNIGDNQSYVVTTEGLFIINGSTWRKVENLPNPAVSLAVDPDRPQVLYAGTVAYGVYRSEDGGRSWTQLNEGLAWQPGLMLQIPAIAVDNSDGQHLVLATAYNVGSQVVGEGIYESFTGGKHWVKIAEVDEVIKELVIKDGGVYAATSHGLTRYGDPMPAAPWTSALQSRSLAHPSALQVAVLVLTVLTAGWILLGQLSWLPQRQ